MKCSRISIAVIFFTHRYYHCRAYFTESKFTDEYLTSDGSKMGGKHHRYTILDLDEE